MPYSDRKKLYAAQKKHRTKIRSLLLEFLKTKECIKCGEKDPIVLEFDHLVPGKKFKSVSKMMSGHYSWRAIQKEIEKCQVLCANCHRRRTHKQFGFLGRSSS